MLQRNILDGDDAKDWTYVRMGSNIIVQHKPSRVVLFITIPDADVPGEPGTLAHADSVMYVRQRHLRSARTNLVALGGSVMQDIVWDQNTVFLDDPQGMSEEEMLAAMDDAPAPALRCGKESRNRWLRFRCDLAAGHACARHIERDSETSHVRAVWTE